MTIAFAPSRRAFVQASGATALVLGVHIPLGNRGKAVAAEAAFTPNAFVQIGADNTITVVCKHIEFGQGPYTGVATILADELDADWNQIRVVSAPADVEKYANSAFGVQGTGGSTAMANSWDQLRTAGAEARARLIAAAAAAWNVGAGEITIDNGVLKHSDGKSGTFGEFVDGATRVTLTAPATPKTKDAYRYIGKHVPKVDTVSKTNGTAQYTIDVKLPDMLTCVIARPPRFAGKAKSFDASGALTIKGVKEVFTVPQGVAVLATGYWPARKGMEALKVEWDESGTEGRGTEGLMQEFKKLADDKGVVARNDGDIDGALSGAATIIEATYTFPYLAHAPMEPNDCVIRRTADGGVEMLFGSQMPTVDQASAAKVLGLDPKKVSITTLLAGGSFGRRATPSGDMAIEAADVLKAAKHQGPIKVIWTREDDIKGGRYRPVFVHKLKGGVDKDGKIVAWQQVIVGQSFMKGSPFESAMLKDGVDVTMVEGAATLPYQIPNLEVSAHIVEVGVPTLWWRSVGSTHTAYSTETFLDELAALSGTDPLEIRRQLLAKHPRHLGVLNLAAEKAGWGSSLPDGKARGIAVHESFKSFVAQVVEVSLGEDGLPKVERVVCAVDCGIAINPEIIKAQMEGGIGYGLSGSLYGAVDLDNGVVRQSNFHDYRVLRINEMPTVEVYIVPSEEKPTGVGEPGVPPIAPAVANAWAKLTGQRIHDLPFSRFVPNA
ncbi:MAG: xanthine dehydrogenase family protein molybdopterin-binding subunit [Hyphomicrobiaceae bacterium]|nr:xanthine dehydrogenase family protein molybdopterin-binding subunit [Hyphomicrobiaceae bacterium]